jgi:hypothetical protein
MSEPTRIQSIRYFFTQGGCIQTEDAWWLIEQVEQYHDLLELLAEQRQPATIAECSIGPEGCVYVEELERLSEPT